MAVQKKQSKSFYLVFLIIFLVALDFYISNFILAKIADGSIFQLSWLHFNFVKNTGAAFSLLQNSTVLLSVISTIAVLFLVSYTLSHVKNISYTGLFYIAILNAGILGNLLERIYFGYVRDFFEIILFEFPVFNISDVFINVGVFAIIILLIGKKHFKI